MNTKKAIFLSTSEVNKTISDCAALLNTLLISFNDGNNISLSDIETVVESLKGKYNTDSHSTFEILREVTIESEIFVID